MDRIKKVRKRVLANIRLQRETEKDYRVLVN
jgi:hypothetical protein